MGSLPISRPAQIAALEAQKVAHKRAQAAYGARPKRPAPTVRVVE